MKRNAYTLAETLITVGIVGVLAAMVIPTVVTGHMKQVYAQRLATAVTDFENAMTTMINAEAVEDLLDTEAWQVIKDPGANSDTYNFFSTNGSTTEAVKNELQAKLGKYIAIIGHRDSSAQMYRELDGDAFISDTTDAVHYKTKKGIEYLFIVSDVNKDNSKTEVEALSGGFNYQNCAARIFIDVNAEEGPNRFGRDLFSYDLSVDGKLYANGSANFNFYREVANTPDVEQECVVNRNGLFCAEYLAKNNYKMDY